MLPKIIVFAKAPVAGRVKTRLCSYLNPSKAAELYSALVRDTLQSLLELTGTAQIELCTDVETEAWSDLSITRSLQHPGDLGERLYAAFAQGLSSGSPSVMIVGSDSPGIPIGSVETLLGSSTDAALGPAQDGGYYAMVCRRTEPAMFHGVRWSTCFALDDTVHALQNCGLTVSLGLWWFDVDEPADVQQLLQMQGLPVHTANWLSANRESLSRLDTRQ